jgi:RNA polymerase sigma-70 factor, ECF subfamily
MDITPASLLERLRQPADHAAWERFVELYTPLLYYWSRRAGLQQQDAADLVQDVLTLLLRKMPQFNYHGDGSFHKWLRTVMLNKLRENLRRAGARQAAGGSALDDVPAPDDAPELEEAEYRRHIVQRALKVLEPEFSVLTWKAFQEYGVAGRDPIEVAAELHVQVGTVYAAKSRVFARLRQELEGLVD